MCRARGKYLSRLFGIRFWTSSFIVFVLFQLDTGMPILFSKYHWQVLSTEWDIASMLNNAIFFGMYIQMICIASTTVFASSFCEEWHSGITPWLLNRYGINKYSIIHILLAAFSGGSVSSMGFVLYLLSCKINNVQILNPIRFGELKMTLSYDYLVGENKEIEYAVVMLLIYFMTGALAAIIAMCISAVKTNRYVVMIAPYLIYRVYVEFSKIISLSNKYRVDYYLFGRNKMGKSYIETIMIILVILISTIVAVTNFYLKEALGGN